jgi:hypothetical protein
MLSGFLLRFKDAKINRAYTKEKRAFYNRVLPLITLALIALLVSIEIIYRVQNFGEIQLATSIINAVAVFWFGLLTVITRCNLSFSKLVCPSLIALVYYYVTWIDYDSVNASIFYKTVLGITICFFLLVVFNEAWLLTTIVYCPFAIYFMHKSGLDMLQDAANNGELTARSIFVCFIFAVVAYQMEKLNKESFLGREAGK